MRASLIRPTARALGVGLDSLLVALFPPRCGSCEVSLPAFPHHGLCEHCFEVLEPNVGLRCRRCDLPGDARTCPRCARHSPPFVRLRAPYLYGGGITDLVVAAKFQGREDLAGALGHLLADDDDARTLGLAATALVPVPLGGKRRRARGYNQSAIIARALGRSWGVPVLYALRRARNTAPQSDLPLEERRSNIEGAFVPRLQLKGTVALVDDVVTSGETVGQASLGLRAAGAAEIVVITVARVG